VRGDVPLGDDVEEGRPSYLGQLLVATPVIDEPVFRRTVVLLVDHDSDGALGVVLNRPTSVAASEVQAGLAVGAAEPEVVFDGGPVQPEVTVALSAARGDGLCAWTVVDPFEPPDLPAPLRLFRGYAGWAPGQLDGEIAAGAWWVITPHAEDLFSNQPGLLWQRIVRRQGMPLSFAANWLTDPKNN
jgi:putative transcriptional regulator